MDRGPGGNAGSPAAPHFDRREERGVCSTVRPRTTHRIDRQMKRNSSANSPYFSAESAKGVTPVPTTSTPPELENRAADRDPVSVLELAGLDGLPIEPGPVRRPQVGQSEDPLSGLDLGMAT